MAQEVALVDRGIAVYSSSVAGLVTAATATDIFTLTNPVSNKVLRVTAISIAGTATAAAAVRIDVIKRTAANTGGTSTAPVIVLRDSAAGGVASGVVLAYTANPAGLGAATAPNGGLLTSRIVNLSVVAGPAFEEFIDLTNRPITLRAGEVLALNMAGVTVAGDAIYATFVWSEQ